MSQDHRSDHVRELFVKALRLPVNEREALLGATCKGDKELQDQVHKLLERHRTIGDFLERPVIRISDLSSAEKELQQKSGEIPVLKPNDRVGDFDIVRFLARGGGGEVYLAQQRSLGGRRVALKILSSAGLTPKNAERFLREVRLVSSLHHPNLVTVYDCGEDLDRGHVYYTMRLIEGPTMSDVLASLSEAGGEASADIRMTLVRRILEVARALAALHSCGLVHGDVKPSNVLLEKGLASRPWENPAVVIDFGLVRRTEQPLSTVWATPTYAAPELLMLKPIDARADVYSLGLALHDLLAARTPEHRFSSGSGEIETLRELAPEVDFDLEAVVARATERDPALRYANAELFADDLERWLEGVPVTARPLRGLERVRRFVRRNPQRVLAWSARLILTAALFTLAVAGAIKTIAIKDAIRHASELRAQGDLAGAIREARQLPPLCRFFAPGLFGFLNDVQSSGNETAAADVTRIQMQGDTRLAALVAARYVERDGLTAHTDVARFLLRTIESPQQSGAEPGHADLSLVARLFYERPDERPEDVAASVLFRARLLSLLAKGESSHRTLHVLTALSGCGTPDEIPAIAERMLISARGSWETSVEEVQLSMEAIAAILRRSYRCETVASIENLDLDRLLEQACQSYRECRQRLSLDVGPLRSLFVAVGLAHRWVDRKTKQIQPCLPGMPDLLVRCAQGNHSVKPDLVKFADAILDYEPRQAYRRFFTHGLHVGTLDTSLGPAMGELANAIATSAGLKPEVALEQYRAGLEFGEGLQRGVHDDFVPDEDTHLGAYFEESKTALEPFPLERVAPQDAEEIAFWDFEKWEQRGLGESLEARVTNPDTHLRSDQDPLIGYVRLGIPGFSELRLDYTIPLGTPHESLQLELKLQKGMRRLLPYRGEAYVSVLFDKTFEAARLSVVDGGLNRPAVTAFLPTRYDGLPHSISLRLDSDSNTTVRIHSARLILRKQDSR